MKQYQIRWLFLIIPFKLWAGSTVFLNDTFEGYGRTDELLPASARWFGGACEVVQVASGDHALKNAVAGGGLSHMVGYFAPEGNPVALGPGQALRLRFELTPTSIDPEEGYVNLRLGLLHSGSARVSSDANTSLSVQGGYGLFVNPQTAQVTLREKSENPGPLFTSLPAWSEVKASVHPGSGRMPAMKLGQTYSIEWTVRRPAGRGEELWFDYSITDGVHTGRTSFTSASPDKVTLNFDTVGFAWGGTFGDGLIDNVRIALFRLNPSVYLQDDFDDGVRTNAELPRSARWFGGTGSEIGLVEVSEGDFALKISPQSATIRHAVAYFDPEDAPGLSLTPGESLRLSFDLTPLGSPSAGDNNVRLGLLRSGGSRLSGDSNPALSVEGGYGIFMNPDGTRIHLREKKTDAGGLFHSVNVWSEAKAIFSPQGEEVIPLTSGVTYSLEWVISRLANDQLRFDFSLSDGARSVTATFNPSGLDLLNYSFDTVGVAWGNAFGDGLIDHVRIARFPTEPQVYLSDGFDDHDRTRQDLPFSAQWIPSAGNLSLVETDPGNYALKNSPADSSIRHAVAYFDSEDASGIRLSSPGDTIRLSFDLTPLSEPSAGDQNFRFGLLHSGESRVTELSERAAVQGGYGIFVNPDGSKVTLREKLSDEGPLFSSLSYWSTSKKIIVPEAAKRVALTGGSTCSIELIITRLADEKLRFDYTMRSDTNSMFTSFDYAGQIREFDTVGFAWGSAFGDGLIDHVRIDRGPALEFALYYPAEVDRFIPGIRAFSDLSGVLSGDLPGELNGMSFIRSAHRGYAFRSLGGGEIYLLLRDGVTYINPSLEEMGFERTAIPDFQLHGSLPENRVSVHKKRLEPGDEIKIDRYALVVSRADIEIRRPGIRPGTEILYNGIELASDPRARTDMLSYGYAPTPVPYLENRPAVVPIDIGRQLFVDDFLIEETTLARSYHLAEKFEGNPVMSPETELEKGRQPGISPKSGGLWWDPKDRIFKLWYEAAWNGMNAYATSPDGINWNRPNLGLVDDTNAFLPDQPNPVSTTVFIDYDAKTPAERFKMFSSGRGDLARRPGYSMVSADGIHWSEAVRTGDTGDRSSMFYNPFRKKWVYSIRSTGRYPNAYGRSRFFYEHSDFMGGAMWFDTDLVFWTGADNLDPPDPEVGDLAELYNLDAVAYESLMLGIYQIHVGPANSVLEETGIPKRTDLKLAFSRDGFHWHRPDRRAFIPSARSAGYWDKGYVQSVGGVCVIVGDELRFYYSAYQGTEEPDLSGGMYSNASLGFARLRRDGFASMEADGTGYLTTRPVTFSDGRHLFVNADCPGGQLRVEVLSSAHVPYEGFTLAECEPLTVDSTRAQVRWTSGKDLSELQGEPVRFRFELTAGSLYAFWVSPAMSGASGGYTAAGGPGFVSNIDTPGSGFLFQVFGK